MRLIMVVIAAAATAASAAAEVESKSITYEHAGETLQGFLVWDSSVQTKRPGVLVVHEWWGLNEYAQQRAKMLAEMGYVAFACDMYGGGKVVDHPSEAGQMANKVRENVEHWRGRALAGLDVLKNQSTVGPDRLAAIGYCFGGSTVLQLALAGADLDAVVSFHGALPDKLDASKVKASVLISHGAADNFIPEANAVAVRKAFEQAGVDYVFVYHGGARHSFTVPDAAERGVPGIKYDADANRRSWDYMQLFLENSFAE